MDNNSKDSSSETNSNESEEAYIAMLTSKYLKIKQNIKHLKDQQHHNSLLLRGYPSIKQNFKILQASKEPVNFILENSRLMDMENVEIPRSTKNIIKPTTQKNTVHGFVPLKDFQSLENVDKVEKATYFETSESQWGSDTQLMVLADNADAIVNMMNSEMQNCYHSNDPCLQSVLTADSNANITNINVNRLNNAPCENDSSDKYLSSKPIFKIPNPKINKPVKFIDSLSSETYMNCPKDKQGSNNLSQYDPIRQTYCDEILIENISDHTEIISKEIVNSITGNIPDNTINLITDLKNDCSNCGTDVHIENINLKGDTEINILLTNNLTNDDECFSIIPTCSRVDLKTGSNETLNISDAVDNNKFLLNHANDNFDDANTVLAENDKYLHKIGTNNNDTAETIKKNSESHGGDNPIAETVSLKDWEEFHASVVIDSEIDLMDNQTENGNNTDSTCNDETQSLSPILGSQIKNKLNKKYDKINNAKKICGHDNVEDFKRFQLGNVTDTKIFLGNHKSADANEICSENDFSNSPILKSQRCSNEKYVKHDPRGEGDFILKHKIAGNAPRKLNFNIEGGDVLAFEQQRKVKKLEIDSNVSKCKMKEQKSSKRKLHEKKYTPDKILKKLKTIIPSDINFNHPTVQSVSINEDSHKSEMEVSFTIEDFLTPENISGSKLQSYNKQSSLNTENCCSISNGNFNAKHTSFNEEDLTFKNQVKPKHVKTSEEIITQENVTIEGMKPDFVAPSPEMLAHLCKTKINDCQSVPLKVNKNMEVVKTESGEIITYTEITAESKKLDVSENALDKVKNISGCLITEPPIDGDIATTWKCNELYCNDKVNNNYGRLNNNQTINHEIVSTSPKPSSGFGGFTTANNKHIAVSEDALDKVKNIFGDLDDDQPINQKNISVKPKPYSSSGFGGFTTANNKQIAVSKDALDKVKNIFGDLDDNQPIKKENTLISPKPPTSGFGGFTTANNKNIAVSKEALDKVMNIFGDLDDDQPINQKNIPINPKPYSSSGFGGFTTANNKQIAVSTDTLDKVKNIFGSLDDDQPIDRGSISMPPSSGFGGFTTANNKNIAVSKDALDKVKNIFGDLDDDQPKAPLSSGFGGFTTANNKNIAVTKDALDKVKNIFGDLNDDQPKPPLSSGFGGFTTANNKNIAVSKDALDKVKNIFGDLDDDQPKPPLSSGFGGFTTANNKNIAVSKEALDKVKNIFGDLDDDQPKPPLSSGFGGFTIANNKNIAVSKDALDKVKNIFGDLDDDQPKPPLSSGFGGFTTANNKNIAVTKDALDKIKNIFGDLDDDQPKPSLSSGFGGFTTANNKNIAVSKDALDKVKNIFGDLDDDQPKPPLSSGFGGFTTANNKNIAVTKDALDKVKNIFGDLDDDQPVKNPSISTSPKPILNLKGFTTASNKHVHISKESLENVKGIFDEFDISFCNDKEKDFSVVPTANIPPDNDMNQTLGKSITDTNINSATYQEINKNAIVSKDIVNDLSKISSFQTIPEKSFISNDFHDGFTQEISESALAILDDESFECDNTPCSPILKFKSKRKKSFKVPYKVTGDFKEIKVVSNPKICKHEEEFIKIKLTEVDATRDIDLGNLFCDKRNGKKMLLSDVQKMNHSCTTVDEVSDDILKISPENFEKFTFRKSRIDFNFTNRVSEICINDLVDVFYNHKDVDKMLIPAGWILNHLKWIIWKLASYERRFQNVFREVLTVSQVLKQLKYRYDRELFKAERPCLRRVLEKDDVASRQMVLCVARVVQLSKDEHASDCQPCPVELELTDGWYSVLATPDHMILTAVQKGRVEPGTKLAIYGAQLINCGQGVSPLEDIKDVRLLIYGNSTRRAVWSSKLGIVPSSAPPRLNPLAVRPRAGVVPLVRLLLLQIYPPLFMEKLPSGETVTRNEKLELQYCQRLEGLEQAQLEHFYDQAEREAASWVSDKEAGSADSLAARMDAVSDPGDFLESLSASEQQSLQLLVESRRYALRQRVEERVLELVRKQRVSRSVAVVRKLRAAVLDHRKITELLMDGGAPAVAFLTIWKSSASTVELLREGMCVDVMNLTSTGTRNDEIHFSAGGKTMFTEVSEKKLSKNTTEVNNLWRKYTSIQEMNNSYFFPKFNEVDTVGFVFHIEPAEVENSTVNSNVQIVYMADDSMNLLAVNFWGGLARYGYEKVIKVDNVFALCNLQHRPRTSRRRIRHLYVTELSTCTRCPKRRDLDVALKELERHIKPKDAKLYTRACLDTLNDRNNSKAVINNSNLRMDCDNSLNSSALENAKTFDRSKRSWNDVLKHSNLQDLVKNDDLSLSGLDFDSTFDESTNSNLHASEIGQNKSIISHNQPSINSSTHGHKATLNAGLCSRMSDVEKRIKRIEMYGEPPPLAPVVLNISKRLKKEFVLPNFNSSTEKIGSENLEDSCDNKYYSSVKNICDSKYSPPLSLD